MQPINYYLLYWL